MTGELPGSDDARGPGLQSCFVFRAFKLADEIGYRLKSLGACTCTYSGRQQHGLNEFLDTLRCKFVLYQQSRCGTVSIRYDENVRPCCACTV